MMYVILQVVVIVGPKFKEGQYVICEGEDSFFSGIIVKVFAKYENIFTKTFSNKWRYIIQDERGLLLIKSEKGMSLNREYEV